MAEFLGRAVSVLENLLDAARVDVHGTNKGSEVTLCCPFCETRGFSSDVNFHLGLNTFNGKAHCFRCDWKSSNALYTARQLIRVYEITFDFKERELTVRRTPEKKKAATELKAVGLPEGYEALTGELDFVGRRVRRYLTKRGVSLLQIVKHRVGYACTGTYAWRAIFPVIGADGKVYGCVGRSIQSDVEPKYYNSPGLKMLWNTERPASKAVVVEGVMDALRVEQALLRTTGVSAVARLGSTITQIQIDQLREYDDGVIIFPDFDMPGLKGAMELGERLLSSHVRPVSVIVPDGVSGRDPGSMDDDEIMEYITGAKEWGAGTVHRLRIASNRRVDA